MNEQERPLRPTSAMSAGFWEAAERRQLVVQRCECGQFRHYPQPMCPTCLSMTWSWAPVSGRGAVYSFTVTHRAFHAAWRHRLPYAVATIELEEGVRMLTDLPDDDTDDVHIGAPVEVFFDDNAGRVLPRFRLIRPDTDLP
ncbi:MAG: hypothetical protein JWN96_3280 [Mycobacterium sp.]|nr:hypothetical protein [Mycobacterium sp.]